LDNTITIKQLSDRVSSLGYTLDTPLQRDFLFKAIRNRLQVHINNLTKTLAKEFRKQQPEVMRKVNSLNINNAKRRTTEIEFFNMNKWVERFAKESRHDIFMATQDGYIAGSKPLKGYGYLTDLTFEQKATVAGEIGFTEDNVAIQDWLDNETITFSKNINASVQTDLNRIVKRGIKAGGNTETIRQFIEDGVNKKYTYLYGEKGKEQFTAWQARRMALTETAGAQNSGHHASLVDSGVVEFKGWLDARNGKVRDTHITAGQTYTRNSGIPLKQNFIVGGAVLSSPGNLVSGDVGEKINCHCALIASRKGKKITGKKPKAVQDAVDEEVPLPTLSTTTQPVPKGFTNAFIKSATKEKNRLTHKLSKLESAKDSLDVRMNKIILNAGDIDDFDEILRIPEYIPLLKKKKIILRAIQTVETNIEKSMRNILIDKIDAKAVSVITTDIDSVVSKHTDIINKATTFYKKLGLTHADTLEIWPTSKSRAFYSGGGFPTVALPTSSFVKTKTVVHEMGHWIEDKYDDVAERASTFLKRRAGNETPVSLNKLTGSTKFGADEIAYKDNFTDVYAGKVYTDIDSTELISMGLEYFYTDSLAFAKADPDYFEFILDIVRLVNDQN